jgi:hypothetical protein
MKNIYNEKSHKKIIALGVFLLLFNLGLFSLISSITSYTRNNPGTKIIGSRVKEDNEVLSKKVNINDRTISVSEGEYTFNVEEAKLNDEGLVITGSVSGPAIVYKDGIFPPDVEIVPKDFNEESTADGGGNRFNGDGDTFTFMVVEKYKSGEVQKFLSKGQKYITLDVMIYRRNDSEGRTLARRVEEEDFQKRDYRVYWKESDEPIKEFKSISVPFTYNTK